MWYVVQFCLQLQRGGKVTAILEEVNGKTRIVLQPRGVGKAVMRQLRSKKHFLEHITGNPAFRGRKVVCDLELSDDPEQRDEMLQQALNSITRTLNNILLTAEACKPGHNKNKRRSRSTRSKPHPKDMSFTYFAPSAKP
jgi:hypothetical protein